MTLTPLHRSPLTDQQSWTLTRTTKLKSLTSQGTCPTSSSRARPEQGRQPHPRWPQRQPASLTSTLETSSRQSRSTRVSTLNTIVISLTRIRYYLSFFFITIALFSHYYLGIRCLHVIIAHRYIHRDIHFAILLTRNWRLCTIWDIANR